MKIQPHEKINFTASGAIKGARQSLPLVFGVFSNGAVFGMLARQAGLSLGEASLMSGLVYAGASQFMALGLWIAPLPVITIVLTTLVVNLRHILMGAALRPWFSGLSPLKSYGAVFFMGDESWAMAMREFAAGGRNGAFMLGSGVAQFIAWLSSTVMGYALGAVIEDPARWGLDFIFIATFTALLVGMWKSKSDLLSWGVAATVALAAAHWLPGKWYILLGGIAGSLAGAFGDNHAD